MVRIEHRDMAVVDTHVADVHFIRRHYMALNFLLTSFSFFFSSFLVCSILFHCYISCTSLLLITALQLPGYNTNLIMSQGRKGKRLM